MLRLRSPRARTVALVDRVEGALGTCFAVSGMREHPDDLEALDRVVSALREQADLVGGSDEAADVAEVAAVEALETAVTERKLALLGIDPREVRRRSLAALAPFGLAPSADRVPVRLEAYAGRRRSPEEAVDRVRALMAVLHAVHGATARDVGISLQSRGLVNWCTPQERAFLALLHQRGPDATGIEAHRAWIGRRVEGVHALGWALGVLPDLQATGHSDIHPSAFAPVLPAAAAGDPTGLRLRDQAELLGRLDLLTCAHRELRERELRGLDGAIPPDVVPGAVAERRRALEWLLGRESWDDIDVDLEIQAGRGA